MKYTTIKSVLRGNIKAGTKVLWTWDRDRHHFTQIFKDYSDNLPIYTPSQLMEEIEKELKGRPAS
jgi:hypothetical protein|tara:strand:- start:197 stop:391 length:195 start_codon:yes stop_codon:yes gene_type:complete